MTPFSLDPALFIRLLTWLSPAFPTGAYAYSHGLEWAVAKGWVDDERSLGAWLDVLLEDGSAWNDALLLRASHRRARTGQGVEELAALAAALGLARERREESLAQGEAFARAAEVWGGGPVAPLPVAFGSFAASQGVDEDVAVAGYLHAFVANLVSAGVRLIPLGQSAGLAVLAAREPAILSTLSRSRLDEPLAALGGAAFCADLAAMAHETQETRLFRS